MDNILNNLEKQKKKHEALNNAFYEVEILLSLEDNFSFLNQLEFHIRNFFGINLNSLYKRVLRKLKNKDGIYEITPKVGGKLYEFYRITNQIYKLEDSTTKYSWERKKRTMTFNDIPFVKSHPLFRKYFLEDLEKDFKDVSNSLNNSKNIKEFINNLTLRTTNIKINEI